MDTENDSLILNRVPTGADAPVEIAKPTAEVAADVTGATLEAAQILATYGPGAIFMAPDPKPRRFSAKYFNATKSPYNFQRERARRRRAKESRRINRKK